MYKSNLDDISKMCRQDLKKAFDNLGQQKSFTMFSEWKVDVRPLRTVLSESLINLQKMPSLVGFKI